MIIDILFFHIETGFFGGGEKMLLRLLRSLPEKKFNPVVLTQKRGRLASEANKAGIDVKIVPFRGALDVYDQKIFQLPVWKKSEVLLRIIQFNIEARQTLSKNDVIWCQNIRAVLTLLPAICITSASTVWNIGLGMPSEGFFRYLNSISLYSCDEVFIESKTQVERIFDKKQRKKFGNKFTIFNKGIDINRFDPDDTEEKSLDNGEMKVGTAASLIPRKGHKTFINAAANLAEKGNTDIHFYIAGDVPKNKDENYKLELIDLVEEHELNDKFTFLGWVENMPKYLNSLDIFVLASNNEGVPGVVREALSMKTPVVATNVGGTSDIVINGETGYLSPPRDPSALADKIRVILDHQTLAQDMGERGREIVVSQHSMDKYTSDYKQFLTEIAD